MFCMKILEDKYITKDLSGFSTRVINCLGGYQVTKRRPRIKIALGLDVGVSGMGCGYPSSLMDTIMQFLPTVIGKLCQI